MKIKLYFEKEESDPACSGNGVCGSVICSDKVSDMGAARIWCTLFWDQKSKD